MKKYFVFTGIYLLAAWLFLDVCKMLNLSISISYLDYVYFSSFPYMILAILISIAFLVTSLGIIRFISNKTILCYTIRTISLHLFIASILIFLNTFLSFGIVHIKLAKHYHKFKNILIQSTEWSKNFSESGFSQIKVNLSKNEVVKILGDPLREFEIDNLKVLLYSDIGHYGSIKEKGYHQRWIVLNTAGKVDKVLNRYLTTENDPLSF